MKRQIKAKKKRKLPPHEDAWQEYLALTPFGFLPSEPKKVFRSGWEFGVEWAMKYINGPAARK